MDMGMMLGAGLLVALVILAIAIVIAVFYFLTLMRALNQCSPRNRLMEPGLVWLGLIPIFNIVWAFFIAIRVPDSLKNEFRDRGIDDGSDYGKGIGLTNAILGAASVPIGFVVGASQSAAMGILSNLLSLASLVLFIVFWVKIAQYSGRLASGGYDDRRFDDRDYDDRPRRDAGVAGDAGSADAYRQDDRNRIQ